MVGHAHLILLFSSTIIPVLTTALHFSMLSGKGSAWSSPDTVATFGSSSTNDYGAILTDKSNSVGWVLYTTPVPLATSSFSTSFTFQILTTTCQGCGGDGMAFMITSQASAGPPDHSSGEFLGLVDGNNRLSGHVFAVEFDTYQNTELNDSSSSHIGIDIDGVVSMVHSDTGPGTPLPTLGFYNNNTFTAWIDYNASSSVIEIRMINTQIDNSRPQLPVLSLQYNLSDIFTSSMFVGFSGSTGVSEQTSIIYSWQFSTDGYVAPLSSPPPPSPPAQLFPSPPLPPYSVSSYPRPDASPSNHPHHPWVAPFASTFFSCLFLGLVAAIIWAWWSIVMHRRRLEAMKNGPVRYSYNELKRATESFNKRLYLGGGSSGTVYKGRLGFPVNFLPFIPFSSSGFIMVGTQKLVDTYPSLKKLADAILSLFSSGYRVVAVKKLVDTQKVNDQEFLAEISLISCLRHKNLVQLLGWCHEKEKRLLVYDYMANGSLDKHLFSIEGAKLKWATRFRILADVAAALEYLHEGWNQCVVHRDVKPGNVMLDEFFNGFLGDFGLACLIQNATGSTTNMSGVGTIGYVAPEVPDMGRYTEKADVYSFGVLTLEMVSGRPVIDYTARKEEENLVRWAWLMHERKKLMEVVDSKLGGEHYEETVKCMLHVGLLCCHPLPRARPSMKQVGVILTEGLIAALPTSRPVLSYSHQLFTPPSVSQSSQCYSNAEDEELSSFHGYAAHWFCSPPLAHPFSPISDTLLSPPRGP